MPDWKSFLYAPRTYTMNSYLREPADKEYPTCTSVLKGIRVQDITQSRNTVLLFEGIPLTVGWENDPYYVYIYRCCNWTRVKGYYSKVAYTIDPGNPWHGRFSNYVYCDGHLKARPPGKYYAPELSTHKEMCEWYVDKAYFERLWETNHWYRNAPLE
jgi:prepilin-type processing-associated H-X9-DG protein